MSVVASVSYSQINPATGRVSVIDLGALRFVSLPQNGETIRLPDTDVILVVNRVIHVPDHLQHDRYGSNASVKIECVA
jgi:hypothetical protein